MIKHCKSTFANQHPQPSFYSYLFIITFSVPLLLQQLPSFVSILFLIYLDYFTSLDFYDDITTTRLLLLSPTATSPILNKEDIDINDNNTSTANNKKSILSIDTTTSKNSSKAAITKQEDQSVDNNNDNNDDIQQQKGNQEADMMVTSPGSAEFTDKLTTKQQQEDNVTKYIQNQQHHHRRRHNSVSAYSDVDFFIKSIPPVPHLSPSTSSVTSFSSNWSLDSGSNRSRVEEMIYLFEMGGRSTPHRRYSVDSHNYYTASKPLIRHRRFEYQPIASEWKKRANSTSVFPTIELSPSKSTPVRRRMPPIPEKSKSTWA